MVAPVTQMPFSEAETAYKDVRTFRRGGTDVLSFCLEWCFKRLFYYEFLRIAVFRADNVEACSQGYRHAVA